MKKLLSLACATMFLAGCSKTPSDSEIEDYIEPLFASCKNIKVGGINKTNGRAEDDGYLIDFDYELSVDADGLDKLRAIYLKEKQRSDQFSADLSNHEQRKRELQEAIQQGQLAFERANVRPSYSAFTSASSPWSMTPAEKAAYDAAVDVWRQQQLATTAQQTAELEELNKAWTDKLVSAEGKHFSNIARIGNELNAFYEEGCSYKAGGFMFGMFREPVQDQVELFDRKEFQMKGKLTMHKTEQGWRVL